MGPGTEPFDHHIFCRRIRRGRKTRAVESAATAVIPLEKGYSVELTKVQIAQFNEDGYLLLRQVLADRDLDPIIEEYEDHKNNYELD